MNQNNEFIRLTGVVKNFNGNSKGFKALDNISLKIGKGEFVVITGKSGSGKSTLLNMLSGIDKPTNGEVSVNKMPLNAMSENELAKWRGKNVGIVFQFFQLMPTLTVLENIILPMEFSKIIPSVERIKRAMELLDKIQMTDHANKFPNLLSGGEKQRVAIARAMANNPDIIIADEPTGNLDSANAGMIHNLFNDLNGLGKTIVYVTHDRDIELKYSRKIIMTDGRITDNISVNKNN